MSHFCSTIKLKLLTIVNVMSTVLIYPYQVSERERERETIDVNATGGSILIPIINSHLQMNSIVAIRAALSSQRGPGFIDDKC